jgi:hypothetical protein
MIAAGWSPSVRLFEAAMCGCPVISDVWEGLDNCFVPGREILLARSIDEVDRGSARHPARKRPRHRRSGPATSAARAQLQGSPGELEQHLEAAIVGKPLSELATGSMSGE